MGPWRGIEAAEDNTSNALGPSLPRAWSELPLEVSPETSYLFPGRWPKGGRGASYYVRHQLAEANGGPDGNVRLRSSSPRRASRRGDRPRGTAVRPGRADT